MYEIEQKGIDANTFFNKKIPVYVKEPIRLAIKPLLKKQNEKDRIKSIITPLNETEFCAECGIFEDAETPLLKFSVYAGTREDAAKIAEKFSKNPDTIYSKIIEILTSDD